jgi:hypothetical protein
VSPFAHKRKHNRTLLFSSTLLKHNRHFDCWKTHARLFLTLSWRWIMLLHNNTHRKPITSIIAIYFHLWSIYWLSLVLQEECNSKPKQKKFNKTKLTKWYLYPNGISYMLCLGTAAHFLNTIRVQHSENGIKGLLLRAIDRSLLRIINELLIL